MKTIKELLAVKGECPIHSIGPDDTVFAAVTKMVEMNIGAILVTEGETNILGHHVRARLPAVHHRPGQDRARHPRAGTDDQQGHLRDPR